MVFKAYKRVSANQMKYLITLLIYLLTISFIKGQYFENCIPKDLIVTGDNVNFRREPNTNTTPIGKFDNGDLLRFIEVVLKNQNHNWIMLSESWLQAQKVSSGEIGFVFGKYVRPQESVNPMGNKIQNGNWYAMYQEGSNVMLENTKPVLFIDHDGDTSIRGSNEKQMMLICSQLELIEGKINGRIFPYNEGHISIGRGEIIMRTPKYHYSLICTGEVQLDDHMGFTRINERLYFVTEEIDGSRRHYKKQDLTDCILKFGEVGYKLEFSGDLNNDGIPEIIFYEADTRESIMYYFMSNKEGQLELKSISGGTDDC